MERKLDDDYRWMKRMIGCGGEQGQKDNIVKMKTKNRGWPGDKDSRMGKAPRPMWENRLRQSWMMNGLG